MTTVAFTLNGTPITADVQPRTHLGDFLRDGQRLSGTHLGCEHGVCGACTVLVNGAPTRSCITLAVACDGTEITTIEGFDHDEVMSDLREAFTKKHGLQCGFCTPGMLIASRDIVLRLPEASERRIREELSGNLCRCTGYVGIVDAVASVLDKRRPGDATPAADTPQRSTAPALPTFVPVTSQVQPSTHQMADTKPVQAGNEAPRQGWTRFDESFVIHKPRATVWELFADVSRVATCLPGAQVLSFDGKTVKGRMTTKLGPIAASFAGSAAIERDAANWSGTIIGAGSDSGSGSRTKGEIAYRLLSFDQDTATRVEVSVLYNLQGALAQFSRSGLAQEFARQLVGQFAANIAAQLGDNAGAAAASTSSLNVGRLMWLTIKEWLRELVFRRTDTSK
ncbi:MAG: 2Fe-2S iron-sulfur cluster binding domain-containing protein [Bradyrhizobium sp.]|nr:2Fe-2S iron-sulfur cluster binding domain-containing protein [Bradyrhizobium sp.]